MKGGVELNYGLSTAKLSIDSSSLDFWSDFTIYQAGWRSCQFRPAVAHPRRSAASRTLWRQDGLFKFAKIHQVRPASTNSGFPTGSHDFLYRGFIDESFDNGVTWTPWKLSQYSKPYADAQLRELSEDNFVPPLEITALVDAVVEFGQAAWDADEASRIANSPA